MRITFENKILLRKRERRITLKKANSDKQTFKELLGMYLEK